MERLVGLRLIERRDDDQLAVEEEWVISGVELAQAMMVDGTVERKPVPAFRTEIRRGEVTAAEFASLQALLTTTS
jgi:hypothetical protein